IAEALEAAHENAIIHRDVKPTNIKITPSGVVKVLDFGVAMAGVDDALQHLAESTMMTGGSQAGNVMGTPAYMSPEQARGQAVDKRSDIWAFGCVLYEAITGRPTFAGRTISETVSKIIERDPDWKVLPDSLPSNVRDLLRRCLQKDPKRRLHDIADA